MTGSRSSAIVAALATALACGCLSPAGAPPTTAFHPLARVAAPPPDAADRTAAQLARAALVGSTADANRALRRMGAIETVLHASDEPPTGLLDTSTDLANTTLDDHRAYRRASNSLLASEDVDPALRARLERFSADDPLVLANARERDAVLLEVARAFNALAEPLGQSISNVQMAPYRLGRSVANYAIQVYGLEPLPMRKRQALALWRDFVARHPDAPEAEQLEPRVAHASQLLMMTRRNRALRVAERALELGRVRLALVYADRALRHVPEDARAAEIRDESARRLAALREAQARSLDAPEGDPTAGSSTRERELALALLLDGDIAGAAGRVDPHGALADEARFAAALARGESGDAAGMWDELEALAEAGPEASNMARHARALTSNPRIHTWGAFELARARDRWHRFKWVWLGPFYAGLPDRGLPDPLSWLVDAPALVEHVGATPMRLINLPWSEALPSARVAATAARNHLSRESAGPRADAARSWLQGYERKRENWVAVLELEEQRPGAELSEIAALREQAAEQYLFAATREPNVALRLGMYRELGNIYPGATAARVAGELARTESEELTAQRIGLSRGFLLENPDLAGPRGLGLQPELLDGRSENAELHPEGITLVGSRYVRVAYLAPGGDDEEPPVHVIEPLGREHLARVVSLLEERSYRNMLLDPLEDVGVDARRDVFLERARLGLADGSEQRLDAIASYTYRGVRERYGIVRHREPILPFELVFQGSLGSMSMGAFPRMHTPRETPDAFLYR